MAKISVIMPVYNSEKYLEIALDSIVNQNLEDIEIICINDGSRDSSLKILQEFANKDSRIVIVNKENEGQSVARNIGVNMAQGEFLGFVDSDDWVDLDYFEKLYKAAKKYNCDVASAGFKKCRKRRQSIKKRYEAELVCTTTNDKIRLDNLPNDNYIWNKIYRREAWINNNFEFQAGRYYEDIALVIKLLHKLGKMITVPDVYYNYRENPDSTVKQRSRKHINDYNWSIKELTKYAEDNDIFLDFGKQIQKKEYIKMFGFTLMKIYYYENLVRYNLFGFLPICKKVIV